MILFYKKFENENEKQQNEKQGFTSEKRFSSGFIIRVLGFLFSVYLKTATIHVTNLKTSIVSIKLNKKIVKSSPF